MIYDYIICGGGSAGSVLANRLSAKSANKVLLLEAGQDTPHGKVPAAVLDSYPGTAYLNPNFTWNQLKVTTEVISHNNPEAPRPPLRTYEQARILGGGSSINGQLANRGAPTDYDEWQARGATGWNWDNVLPYFKKVERDMDFDGPWHGREGPHPGAPHLSRICGRNMRKPWPRHSNRPAGTTSSIRTRNGRTAIFRSPSPTRTNAGCRPRSVISIPERRMRDNLTISTETQVASLIFEGNRCVGVKAMVGGREQEFRGNEIILSCGAIHSPAHLMRAGIGPVGHLRDLGIDVRVALPGVGQRLQDHPAAAVAAFLKPHARIIHDYTRRHIYVSLRYSSNLPDIPPGDMMTVVTNKTSWHAVGEQIGSFIITVYKTYSETGEVKLRSANWRDEPSVDFNLLSDQRDLERMMDGVRRFSAMHLTPMLESVTADPFPASYSDKVRQVGLLSRKNKLLTDGFAKMLDGPEALRKYLLKNYVMEGVTIHDMLTDDEKLEAFVRKAVGRRVACLLHLPHGRGGRPDGGHRQRGPGARGGGAARDRRLDLSRWCRAPTRISRC